MNEESIGSGEFGGERPIAAAEVDYETALDARSVKDSARVAGWIGMERGGREKEGRKEKVDR